MVALRGRYRMLSEDMIRRDMPVEHGPRVGGDATMHKDKKSFVRRPDVLRKFSAENLRIIEASLLEDLPEKLRPVPPRSQSTELAVVKPNHFLSACLPIPDSPHTRSEKSSPLEENASPLKKSFSFRDKFRFFSKDKHEKSKWKTIEEETKPTERNKDHENKSNKRFWFFRNKELADNRDRNHSPIYLRSKSFEFLPRAQEEPKEVSRTKLKKNQSYAYGSSDDIDVPSSEGSEHENEVFYNTDHSVCLKSIKELHDSDHNSSVSTASSGLVLNIFKRESVQDLLHEFDKAVDMFSENYLSDCEPYTKSTSELSVGDKRKSSSFNTLPSPKILQMTKNNKVSEDFKNELNKMIETKRGSVAKTMRRGSVTDWFVLEEKKSESTKPTKEVSEANKYRRAQKKPIQRVRRISSTKYVSSFILLFNYKCTGLNKEHINYYIT